MVCDCSMDSYLCKILWPDIPGQKLTRCSMIPNMSNGNNDDSSYDLDGLDYEEIFSDKKKELLLEHNRTRVTRMSFEKWFFETYKRDYKNADKETLDAYYAGATDEIENNEFLIEQTELKMEHYKKRVINQADDLQMLISLLEKVSKKGDPTEKTKLLIKKVLVSLKN